MSQSSASAKGWEPPSIEELSSQLPQYQIEALLGRGGMGAVYKGRQISLDRPVAIKILSGALEDSDAGFTERFKNEARAMGKLNHPGIVGVYDFGQTGTGLLYIVIEYVDGTDVAKMIAKKGRLHTEHAMAITAHVCDALAYAHERSIIHRDIKPANIMVGYDGVVKVADFGLAKMTKSGESGLTQSGMVMGTLHYMAPEALTLGSAVDQRADIYAVGVMLYQMLTGKLPQGMFEMPSLQVPGLDPRYDKIVTTAMRDDRELRYASAGALRLELDAILTQPVVKVEASAKKTPAALNTQARPKRHGAGHDLQPQVRKTTGANSEEQQGETVTKSNWRLAWAALLVIAVFGGIAWLVLHQPEEPSVSNGELLSESGQMAAQEQQATKESPFINTLGMKFVPVPKTKVLFCVWETRFRDYEPFAKENPADAERKPTGQFGLVFEQGADYPVGAVSWSSAKAFCEWLTKKERAAGKLPVDATYRLPKEAEWMKAVADELESRRPKKPNGNVADEAFHRMQPERVWIRDFDDGFASTAPVGSFKANQLGIYDLQGNVWEWCEEFFDPSAGGNRLLLGGACTDSGFRHGTADNVDGDIGFRIVIELP